MADYSLQSTASYVSTLPESECISEPTMQEISRLSIWDGRGNKISFGQLYEYQRTVVVFIRHFFCGACQSYVTDLARIPQDALDAAGTKIVIIGCGQWRMIAEYQRKTGFQGLVYADPTRKIYRSLGLVKGMTMPPKDEPRRSYVPTNYTASIVRSILGALKQPINAIAGRNGNVSQLGGDFILGPGLEYSYAHRMKHTLDHVEPLDLMAAAEVRYS